MDFQKVAEIARASLMPDFFAVRFEEEGLFDDLKTMLAKVTLPTPMAQLDRIKAIAAAAPNHTAFIDGIKEGDLWTTLREILTKVKVQ